MHPGNKDHWQTLEKLLVHMLCLEQCLLKDVNYEAMQAEVDDVKISYSKYLLGSIERDKTVFTFLQQQIKGNIACISWLICILHFYYTSTIM